MFSPTLRFSPPEVSRQAAEITSSPFFTDLLRFIPITLLVINQARQVVYANNQLPQEARHVLDGHLTGKRPGECLGCVHALEAAAGCGSSAYCRVCGFAGAVSLSEQGQQTRQECIISRKHGESLVLNINTRPFHHQSQDYVFCFIEDISERKTKEMLENIFLHDLKNTSAILSGIQQAYDDLSPGEVQTMLRDVSNRISEEINAYKVITQAENQTLAIRPFPFMLSALIAESIGSLQINPRFSKKKIVTQGEEYSVCTDKTLLRQVIINLLKNALEAGNNQEAITLQHAFDPLENQFTISVKNPQVIPDEVQLKLFRKSFSTKGAGRGWGTYSIKLLTERYLGGTVSFLSNDRQGTIFTLSIPSQS